MQRENESTRLEARDVAVGSIDSRFPDDGAASQDESSGVFGKRKLINSRFAVSTATLVCALLVGWMVHFCQAQGSNPDRSRQEFLDAEQAGPDFEIQGEYEGEVAGKSKLGAHVIAHGEGNFDVIFLPGGLPGAGWDGKTRIKVSAKSEAGKTTIKVGTNKKTLDFGWLGEFTNDVLSGKTNDGDTFSLQHVLRRSLSLGAKPPTGAIVLFDGSHADEWKVVDGFLFHDGNKWATSKKVFRDFKAHLEFRVPFMPWARGQGRANGGFYLAQHNKSSRPGYEIQVLDSFGLEGKNDECGAVYGQKAPLLNMCYPPLSWQTFDIQFKAARFDQEGKRLAKPVLTVAHNGVKIHDGLELEESYFTGGEKTLSAKPGALMLQNYVGKVHYRNIWVVED